jgi:hypothetical protein
MNILVQGITRPFAPLKTWLSGGGHQAARQFPPTPSVEHTPEAFPPLPPVLTPPKLTVELVPRTCWFSHVCDHVSPEQWNRLRKQTARQAKSICGICGGRGPRWPVACHEVWHDDDAQYVQTLVRLSAVCPACQAVKHLGVAELKGHLAEAQAHFIQVNEWTEAETEAYLAHVWRVWEERSEHEWTLDLSWLKACGLEVLPKR